MEPIIEIQSNDITIKVERSLLAGIVQHHQTRWEVEEHLNELSALAKTAGAEVVDTVIQERNSPDPAYFLGKGKIEEIALRVEMDSVNLIIFDDELSPAQVRNLEKALSVKVIDRTALILDIFALHARSSEAKTQVELAQLNYLLPRLTRQWQHLSRQVGGIGTKGPGETQLETDRRLIRTRIARLKQDLKRIEKQNSTQRVQRESVFRAALIGYTNAGKSTLMNALTDAEVLVEDQLFATLDTTIRRLQLNSGTTLLLSDTVGFIRKLPHQLVASFKTTLAETTGADLLVHVVDISHPHFSDHIEVVNNLFTELKISQKERLLVFNKVDQIKQNGILNQIKARYPEAIFVSGKRGIGIQNLKDRLGEIVESGFETEQIRLNFHSGSAEYLIRPLARVLEKTFDDEYIYLTIKYPRENKSKIDAVTSQYK
ncbi:MAG: GTPase HflX [Calditrichaceae bacterium]